MSKEETPITAEEILRKVYSSDEENLQLHITLNPDKARILKAMKQYAQAKLLEALEKEVIKARVSKDISIKEKVLKHIVSEEVLDKYISDAQKYYQTEVKPKYK